MVPTVKRRTLITVPLLVFALAAPAHAAGFTGAESFWSWLLRWVAVTSPADKGPDIDPNGTAGQLDKGPAIDPLGRNGIGSGTGRADVGPDIDPLGRNGTQSTAGQGDKGPMIDPDGGNGD